MKDSSELTAADAAPLEAGIASANPPRLWFWAWVIALSGVAARLLWFDHFQDELQTLGMFITAHLWSFDFLSWHPADGYDALEATRAFAPAYGVLLRAVWEVASLFGDPPSAFNWILAILQSLVVGVATLLTVALARRVLFGWWALAPAVLMTISVALLEMTGGLAEQVMLMSTLVLTIWLLTVLRERVPDLTGAGPVFLTIACGLAVGASILFDPACLLLAAVICWWAFRAVGREHAILLLVSVLLLPACWLAVVESEAAAGIPTEQIEQWWGEDSRVADTPTVAAKRAYAVITPWNPRFSRGAWSSTTWSYEWAIPFSLRGEPTYISATRLLAAIWMLLYLALMIGGVWALMLEGAGAAARLLAFPVLTLPLATFVTTTGGLLRLPILPFLMIAICVGLAWLTTRKEPTSD